MSLSKFNVSYWQNKLDSAKQQGIIDKPFIPIFEDLIYSLHSYATDEKKATLFDKYLNEVLEQCKHPITFNPFHRAIEKNYQLGMDFFSNFVDEKTSVLLGKENVHQMAEYIKNQQNVIIFSNHQTEPDPQLIDIGLQNASIDLGKQMIFVAGERVVTDPFTIPFSLGCNLICIYSKKYIDHPPEKRTQKLQHNQKTMQKIIELLASGGKIIWLAASGGRDRPDEKGNFIVAPFDPASIAMFQLLAKKAKTKTHFFPLSLKTYPVLPPPDTRQKSLGEKRILQKKGIGLYFGNEIDIQMTTNEQIDIKEQRNRICEIIFNTVNTNYQKL